MAEGNERSWWRRTRVLAISVLAIGGGLIVATILAAPGAGDASPASAWRPMATLGTPLLVIGLIFWAANRQARLDAAHDLDGE